MLIYEALVISYYFLRASFLALMQKRCILQPTLKEGTGSDATSRKRILEDMESASQNRMELMPLNKQWKGDDRDARPNAKGSNDSGKIWRPYD